MGRRQRFRRPPEPDPLRASLALRLNFGFFLRQLAIFLVIDLALLAVLACGVFFWAERRCAQVAELVAERGVPSEEAQRWMEAGDYTITPLSRPPEGITMDFGWLPLPESTREGLRSYDLTEYYTVELPNHGEPYAITVELEGIARFLYWAGVAVLALQGLALAAGLIGGSGAIRRTLRPIQELAAAAQRLNASSHTSRQEIRALEGALGRINATHLDSRLDLPATQKELRSLAQAINAMLDRVNAAYAAQMQFVSDASHELRTPIAVIQGYASLLDRWGKDDPEARQESIDAIKAETAAMQRLVEQLLFLARGDKDSQPVRLAPLELRGLAEEALREESMIHPDYDFQPRWDEGAWVEGDGGLLKQVLRILLDNSVKYSSPGSQILLWISPGAERVRLTVQDEGMGIPPESIPHIFDRFYRTDASRARQTGGTGLGLSIAKWIVERHGGWFEVASREGVGTRISFLLPQIPPPEKETE